LTLITHALHRVYQLTRGKQDARAAAAQVMQLAADHTYGVVLASTALHAAHLHSQRSKQQQEQQQQKVPQAHHLSLLRQLGMSWLLSEPRDLLLPALNLQNTRPQEHCSALQFVYRLRAEGSSTTSVFTGSSRARGQQGAFTLLFLIPAAAGTAAAAITAAAAADAAVQDEGQLWFMPAQQAPPSHEFHHAFEALLVLLELLSLDTPGKDSGVWLDYATMVDRVLRAAGGCAQIKAAAEMVLSGFLTDLIPAAVAAIRAADPAPAGGRNRRSAAAAAAAAAEAAVVGERGGTIGVLAGLVSNMIMFSELQAHLYMPV
jgi:hypothetical protein